MIPTNMSQNTLFNFLLANASVDELVENYTHDYRDMAMNREELKNMLGGFVAELEEAFSKVETPEDEPKVEDEEN